MAETDPVGPGQRCASGSGGYRADAVGGGRAAGGARDARSVALAAVAGGQDLNRHRDDIYSEYYNASIMFSDPDPLAFLTMVRTERHKLVAVHGLDDGELYDLELDPDETQNHWHDVEYRDVKVSMLTRLCDRMAWTVDPLPVRSKMHPMNDVLSEPLAVGEPSVR